MSTSTDVQAATAREAATTGRFVRLSADPETPLAVLANAKGRVQKARRAAQVAQAKAMHPAYRASVARAA
jgi:hypothetical protein